jgi:hypothetical protein
MLKTFLHAKMYRMRSTPLLTSLMVCAAVIISSAAHAQSAFDQGVVQTRSARTPQKIEENHKGGEAHKGHSHGAGGHDHDHGIETENMFGFTFGSDTDSAGSKIIAAETVARFNKSRGSYTGIGQKLEFGYGLTDNVSVAFGILGDYHRIRNVPSLQDVSGRYNFNGIGGELRWRILNRETAPFGMTLHLEPSIARIDEASGLAGSKYGAENKLIFDKELIKDQLFGAINIVYDVERMKERGATEVEKGSLGGITGALSYQVAPKLFLGAETRYLRAYEGYELKRNAGQALYLGPTMFWHFGQAAWLSAGWSMQVSGREAINRRERAEAVQEAIDAGEDPASLITRRGKLDLANFERHQLRLKVGFEF